MARENHVGSVGGSNDDQVSVNLIDVLNTLAPKARNSRRRRR
jgi:hypothetical protein